MEAGKRLAAQAGFGVFIGLFPLLLLAGPLFGQILSGRWEIGAELIPQTTSYEATTFDFGLYSQLDLDLDFAGLGFDGTLFFSNLGLEMAWLGWEATFPAGEAIAAAMKRTLAQNEYVKVLRAFPSPVRLGEAFAVTLIIEALPALPPNTELILIEELPRGWALEPIIPPGVRIAKESHQWMVTLAGPGTREEIRYIAYVPREAAPGSYTLTGTIRSALFPDLDCSDTIEVIPQAIPIIPAKTGLGQDLIFTDGADLTLRMMLFTGSASLDPRLKLTNYLSLYNVGTAQTPSLTSRDTFILEGKTPEGLRARLALRFSSNTAMGFDYGSLSISGLSIEGFLIRGTTIFDGAGLERLVLELDYPTTLLGLPLALEARLTYNDELEMELDYLSFRLSSRFDGLFRLYDYYGPLEYDGDDDGAEEEHFELRRRLIYLEFTLDKFDIRSISTFEPILNDIDADGAKERVAASRLARQELRFRRALRELTLAGSFTWSGEGALGAPLELSLIQFQLAFNRKYLRLTANTTLDLKDHSFAQAVEAVVTF